MSDSAYRGFEEARALLVKAGFTNIDTMVVAAPIGCIIEGVIAGSCLQMVNRYFRDPKRDAPCGRIGIVILMCLVMVQTLLCNSQMYRLVHYYDDYPRTFLLDWFLFMVEGMVYTLVVCAILFLYAWRAYLVWGRKKLVLYSAIPLLMAQFLVGLGCGIYGMAVPWPLRLMSDDEFDSWIPAYRHRYDMYFPLRMTTVVAQLASTLVLSMLICFGVLRHRGVGRETDDAISRIVFISGESLIPMVVLSICFVAGQAIEPKQGILMTRVCGHLSPCIYFHGLMTSLVSRERISQLLNNSSVRHLHDRKSASGPDGIVVTSETVLWTDPPTSETVLWTDPPSLANSRNAFTPPTGKRESLPEDARSLEYSAGSSDKKTKGWDVYAMSEMSPMGLGIQVEDEGPRHDG